MPREPVRQVFKSAWFLFSSRCPGVGVFCAEVLHLLTKIGKIVSGGLEFNTTVMVFFPYLCIILKRTKVSLTFVLVLLHSVLLTEMVSTLESFFVSL